MSRFFTKTLLLACILALTVGCTPAPVSVPETAEATVTPTPAPPESEETIVEQPAATTVPGREIILEAPAEGGEVSSPILLRGSVAVTPFEATLVVRVYDAGEVLAAEVPIMVAGEMGEPGTFEADIPYHTETAGPGRIEVLDLSAEDGSVMASAIRAIILSTPPVTEGIIILPEAGKRITLPLPILAEAASPDDWVTAVLRWEEGVEVQTTIEVLEGSMGQGLIWGNLDWGKESKPPILSTQPATLTLLADNGQQLAQQPVFYLGEEDPNTVEVALFWAVGETVQPERRRVVKSPFLARSALEALLWGPGPRAPEGATTALPTPAEVLAFPGRQPDWGAFVRLLSLDISDGLAEANFSKELWAYGGGSARVAMIRDQVTRTLLEFPEIQAVRILIQGTDEGVLEP